ALPRPQPVRGRRLRSQRMDGDGDARRRQVDGVGRSRRLPDPRRQDRSQGRLLVVPRAAHLLSRHTITVVECHAGGEVGKVVVDGVPPPLGATVFEQMQALAADDSLRRFLLREPRGSVAQHANLLVRATRDDCAYGYIVMEPTEYPPMSGSNTICVATVL